MSETFYVTTPIYYVNDVPHIGHLYTTVAADVVSRYMRSSGRDVMFLTGTDEHGQKVEQAARQRGMSPGEHCDEMVVRFKELWRRFAISNDDFIRTTQQRHIDVVQKFMNILKAKDDIYSSTYTGLYCVPDERFWTEKDLVDGNCPDCGREVIQIDESNYFFRMGKYHDWLLKHIQDNPGFIRPETRRNEILGFLKKPLADLCVSRPIERLHWGIELPFDSDYVTYVWFDALINYVTAAGFNVDDERFSSYWENSTHLVGKDILTTHTVYWPTMLKGVGLPPPKRVFAHGWWTVEGQKMSKSVGNVVEPNFLADEYGPDAIRYFILREVPFGLDGDFSHSALVGRINSDLANDLGNLLQRSLGMLDKYMQGVVPHKPGNAALGDAERALAIHAAKTADDVAGFMDELVFDRALKSIWDLIGGANKYIDSTAPWTLSKDKAFKDLEKVMYTLFEAIRQTAVLISPFMPDTGQKMFRQLGIAQKRDIHSITSLGEWGLLPGGTKTFRGPALFPRIEKVPDVNISSTAVNRADEKTNKTSDREQTSEQDNKEGADKMITIEDFAKVELITARVLEAERVPKSKKLIRLKVDSGEERQLVAGIAEHCEPGDLVGKTIAIVANLKPAKIMGVESKGMLLAAEDDTGVHVLTFDGEVKPGTRIK